MFRYIVFVSLAMSLFGCGTMYDEADMTARKVSFYNNGVDPSVMNKEHLVSMIDSLYNEVSWKGFRTNRMKRFAPLLSVYFVPEVIQCDDVAPGMECYGVTYINPYALGTETKILVWVNNPCLGKTALAHELSHWARVMVYAGQDESFSVGHDDPTFFGDDNSITTLVKSNYIDKYCQGENNE